MSDALFKELDLGRHARMLGRAAGGDPAVAVCDAEGEVLWSGGGLESADVASLLSDAGEEADLLGDEPSRVELGGGRALLCAPIRAGGTAPVGWLALLDAGAPDRGGAVLEDALSDAAGGIASEYRLNREIHSLAGELSGRYEELNLVYTFEGQARALDQGSLGAQALLQNFAEFLDVEVAAFVLPKRTQPIYAVGAGTAIGNLDLVLTQLRGDLYRFVSASRKPVAVNDPSDPRRQYLMVNLDYRVLACPVLDGTSVAAMLALLRRRDQPEFTNGDRNLAKVIAGQTAMILRNQSMVQSLVRFSEQMAAALIEAVEAKDPYTRGHSERVQAISTHLGRAADLPSRDVEDISWGALLHDVGKIGIPDAILCKTGRLSEDEFTLIKIHPERSYEILRHVENLGRNAVDAARYHQEKFDGTGYPHGLRGVQIPVHARVVAVADTYDAITSSRAYRAGQSHEVAMAEIGRVAGSQLDPDFVRVFDRICREDHRWLSAITGLRASLDE